MRVVFFGTPEFAVPALDALARHHEVALVVAQPDRPAGRGMQMQAPAVAVRAKDLGLPLVQPAKIRSGDVLESIAGLNPDAGVVVAYGRILPSALLSIPKHGFLNIHASILPYYRGAAPIQRAIAAGERTTGVTIMRVDEELDHGPILDVVTLEIGPDERAPALAGRLSQAGAESLLRVLSALERGTAREREQDHARATFAPKIEKEEGRIIWSEPAASIYNRFRAFDPWPGVFFDWNGETIKLTEIRPVPAGGEPGTILSIGSDGVVVGAGEGAVRILEMQRPGRTRAAAHDVARGLGWRAGTALR